MSLCNIPVFCAPRGIYIYKVISCALVKQAKDDIKYCTNKKST